MNVSVGWSSLPKIKSYASVNDVAIVQRSLLRCSFISLFLVACLGMLLRAYPFIESFPLSYKNVLHGHSHLAFGGWVMPVLLALTLKTFPELAQKVSIRHWRTISFLLLFSAFGMVIAFPLQGYGGVSIIFSTISLLAGFYLAFVLRRSIDKKNQQASALFLNAGLFYLVLSSIGPFATGPLIAMGEAGSPLYYNAIYFYLHFQYNGWFTFAVLAIFYKMLEKKGYTGNGFLVFWLLNIACIPAYLLSVLWTQPPIVINVLGGLSAIVQLPAVYLLLKDAKQFKGKINWENSLIRIAFLAFTAKCVLQLFSAFPSVAAMAYEHRNFVIAYLHLVLIGFVSFFAFGAVMKYFTSGVTPTLQHGISLFIIAFTGTELLLILQALGACFNFYIPNYTSLLFLLSCFLVAGSAIAGSSILKKLG